jgi:hypothetical protein
MSVQKTTIYEARWEEDVNTRYGRMHEKHLVRWEYVIHVGGSESVWTHHYRNSQHIGGGSFSPRDPYITDFKPAIEYQHEHGINIAKIKAEG